MIWEDAQMKSKHLTIEQLKNKTIDSHCHIGLSLKAYSCLEYPYAQTIEGLYFRQKATGVDISIVFPASASLFFDPSLFKAGTMHPAPTPLSEAPYAVENQMLMMEIFEFNPYPKERFIPFASVDPGRMVKEQISLLCKLEHQYPIYGIKISPVECQSPVTALLSEGKPFLEFAAERNIPILLHTTVDPQEEYSRADLAFHVIDKNPHLRFCLAHCIGFNKHYLDIADKMPNVWVDTAALKIQTQCVREGHSIVASGENLFEGDYSDHLKIMATLMSRYPTTILWGSDSPWYAFISRRMQGNDSFAEFRLSGTYEDEVSALNALPAAMRERACNTNTIEFLFGNKPKGDINV